MNKIKYHVFKSLDIYCTNAANIFDIAAYCDRHVRICGEISFFDVLDLSSMPDKKLQKIKQKNKTREKYWTFPMFEHRKIKILPFGLGAILKLPKRGYNLYP